jgi:tRNA dimethylallyltransferase
MTLELLDTRPVLILLGPTAVGKTRLSLRLAEILKTEILSADSRQVYRGMDIGTAKPTREERERVRHHLIDVVDPGQAFDAGMFREGAMGVIDGLHRAGKIPLVVGGTGLYIRTLTEGLCEAPKADPEVREALLREEDEKGEGTLYSELVRVDPVSARRIHPKDRIRILRALEVYRVMGRPLSAIQEETTVPAQRYRFCFVGLTMDREGLYRRIEDRVDDMVARGLEEEVRGFVDRGYDERLPSMRGLGYKQWLGCLRGDYDRREAVRLLKRDTRRYAKRQMTWFRKDDRIRWMEVPIIDRMIAEIIGVLTLTATERSTM